MNTKDKIYTHITSKTQKDSIPNTKVGEILTEVLQHTRTYGLSLKIESKGFKADEITPNVLFDIEPADIVRGWFDVNTYWPSAMFLGGDPEVKTNYKPGMEIDYSEARDLVIFT